MAKLIELLTDPDGTYSWRKVLTAVCSVLFIAACIGFWAGLKVLPGEYLFVIAGVFGFYFAKNLFFKEQPQLKEEVKNDENMAG